MHRRQLMALAASSAATTVAPAWAQAWPSKPIRLIVPFAPGGTTDIIARVVAEPLAQVLGRPVVVDNKGGAGGAIGAQELARAAPDGYTLGMGTVSTTAANPAINKKLGYDPVADFAPVINIAATPNVLAVNPAVPARDYAAFLALIKREPGKYSYASPGTGSIGHLQMELFKSLAGLFITHIPYRGAGPALNDVVAGQVPIIFDNLPSALPFIKSGKLRPIAVASSARLKDLPDTPTFAEVGLNQVNRMAYYGILAPKGTPAAIVDRLNAAMLKVLHEAAVKKRIEDTGSIVIGNSPAAFARQIRDELAIYQHVVARQKLSI
ncbi:MAG: tripartite tricarboxylate transporter substrate binding protein BugE [Burkholderiaceae bacterium]